MRNLPEPSKYDLALRIYDLMQYEDFHYAKRYMDLVRHVYKRDQFATIWLRTKRVNASGGISGGPGGVAYIIAPPWKKLPKL